MHNRRKRNEWIQQKQIEGARDLAMAIQAARQGVATEDQILLINRERNARQAEIDKKNRPGMFKRASNWLFSDLSKEEQKGGRLGAATAAAATTGTTGTIGQKTEFAAEEARQEARHVLQAVEDKVDQHRRQGEKVPEMLAPAGGPLDRQAQVAAHNAAETTKSWTSWIMGR